MTTLLRPRCHDAVWRFLSRRLLGRVVRASQGARAYSRASRALQSRFELVKIDTDRSASRDGARFRRTPMILFMNGRPVDAIAGNQSEADLRAS